MQPERYPIPFGWIKEFDQTSGQPFYVDTKANPPRSIWTHPYEDQVYLKAHPDVREKLNAGGFGGSNSNLPPPSFEESQRLQSSGGSSPSSQHHAASTPATGSGKPKPERGLFGKLKDKAAGTKEEREAERKRKQERDRLRAEAQRQRIQQMVMARQQLYASQPQYGHGSAIMGAPYGGGYGSHRRRPGMGLPLLGGLAGGLLLGEAFDNDYGDYGGGDYGGGDFGGGDFGGGDFGGF